MVAEEALLNPVVAGTVVEVGAQTGQAVDDVAVVTDRGNHLLVQAKVGLTLGSTSTSELAKALGQAVDQFINGRLTEGHSAERSFDPDRDVIAVCTDLTSPATVRRDLAEAISRTASQPPGTPFGTNLNAGQHRAWKVAESHVRRLWSEHGREADPEELRAFFRGLRVIALDLEAGRADEQAAVSALSRALPDSTQARVGWDVLVAEGQTAAADQEWRDRPAIALGLSTAGIVLAPSQRYAADVALLRDLSTSKLQLMRAEARLPGPEGLYISRAVVDELLARAGRGHLLILGDAGAGKSAVAQDFASRRRQDGEEVVAVGAADLAGVNRVPLSGPFQEVLRAWVGPPALLLIDGVDALRGAGDRDALSFMVTALEDTRWQVVGTARTFDTRNSQPLRKAFAGSPLVGDAEMSDERLHDVQHLVVGDLTSEELASAITPPMALAALLAEAPADLRVLLRNPFNLRLAAELADTATGGRHGELLAVRTRTGLLQRYWDWRVRDVDRLTREALLGRLASAMLTRRTLQVGEGEPTVCATDSAALEALLSQGVLSSLDGPIPGAGRLLSFSHNILFDYATAIHVLYDPSDPSRLLDRLSADPSLPLVARPSFEVLVDLLWEGGLSHAAFWRLAVAVAGSEHVLASLAIASPVLSLVHSPEDLDELGPDHSATLEVDGSSARQKFVGQLVGALRSRAVVPDPDRAINALARLARLLAEHAESSFADAALAANLIQAMQARSPVSEGGADTQDRGIAIAALLDSSRTDPQRREGLAGFVSRHIQYFAPFSPEVRAAVARLLDDQSALRQWGGTVLTWLAEAVEGTASSDPALARRMAKTILEFRESRDEQVSLGGGSILRLHESRKQQATHSTYQLGQEFPAICRTDIRLGAEILCDLAAARDGDTPPRDEDITRWPISVDRASGWLSRSPRHWFSAHEHEIEHQVPTAVATVLCEVPPEDAEAALAILVERLHEPAMWAALLRRPDDPIALGLAILPLLASGSLLAHPATHSQAAHLLRAVARARAAAPDVLEAAVSRAIDLAVTNDVERGIEDVLVALLNEEDISDPGLLARRHALGERSPDIAEPSSVTSWSRPWSIADGLRDDGIAVPAEIGAAAENLREELTRAQEEQGTSSDSTGLVEAFLEADALFITLDSVPEPLALLLVQSVS